MTKRCEWMGVAAVIAMLGVWSGVLAGEPEGRIAALNAHPTPESLRTWHDLLAQETHVAGTAGDARTIERLAAAFGEMGLEVEVHEIWPLLCEPVSAALEIVAPERVVLEIAERVLPEDPATAESAAFGWNAYGGSGDVTGRVVYANQGTKGDFEKLAGMGVDVRGAIVFARYGGNYRGYKAKYAEEAGAAGLVIYTDPGDSGYAKGLAYPEGGYASDCCVQRGSVLTMAYQGDPLTPGVEATLEAERIGVERAGLPRIPVQPIGYGAAREVLGRMTGAAVPEGWQGGLPFTYRVEGGEALRVRLMVEQVRRVRRTANVVATLRGAIFPDEMVIVGCHHDAWNHGAADPLCGTIALMESARAFAAEARAGRPPARTVVFAAWGAEEFGIIGSSEWVEANRERLRRHAVAYINLDMAAMGTNFGASASPSLRGVIEAAAGDVPQPGDAEGRTVAAVWPGTFGDLGGGSDHVGFLCHAGVPSCALGGSGGRGWSYHSAYDTLAWYRKVVGPGYESALMVTRMTNAVASRLADSRIVPLEASAYSPDAVRVLKALTARGLEIGAFGKMDGGEGVAAAFAPIVGAAADAERRAAAAMERLAAAGPMDEGAAARANAAILGMERAWLDEAGLPGRRWFANLYAAPDETSGYAAWILPELARAVEMRDAGAIEAGVARCVAAFGRLGARADEVMAE